MSAKSSLKKAVKNFAARHFCSFCLGLACGVLLVFNYDHLFLNWFGHETEDVKGQWLHGRIDKVIDGDSVTLRDSRDLELEIRLKGIDAPEYSQEYGQVAKAELEMMLRGRQVKVRLHGQDMYRRILGTIFIGSENINEAMVANGHAWAYRFKKLEDAPYNFQELNARKNKKGLWQYPSPINPYEWRKRHKKKK